MNSAEDCIGSRWSYYDFTIGRIVKGFRLSPDLSSLYSLYRNYILKRNKSGSKIPRATKSTYKKYLSLYPVLTGCVAE